MNESLIIYDGFCVQNSFSQLHENPIQIPSFPNMGQTSLLIETLKQVSKLDHHYVNHI